jgi:acetate kinase
MIILVVNAGSSSLKYQLINMEDESVLAKGLVERIGSGSGASLTSDVTGKGKTVVKAEIPDHRVAMQMVFAALTDKESGALSDLSQISAIGHRVLHGGSVFSDSVIIDKRVTDTIQAVSHLGPLHNPANLMGIEAAMQLMPDAPQVAVFDTAFHQTMPKYVYVYALPYSLYTEHGIRRYGFHGTSHKYVSSRAKKILAAEGLPVEKQRVITCHLGNGVSFTAVKAGKSFDTSMGLTPAEGLVMGTRCGDIDPAIMSHVQGYLGYTAKQADDMINKKSGLLGVSGVSNDMRDVEKKAAEGHELSQLALDMFCYRARKYIGAYAAAMGGLDAIVFTAGIGEHSPPVRSKICQGLEFLGIQIDPEKNGNCHGECNISANPDGIRVLVIPTNEELAIARETAQVVCGETGK